MFDNIGRNTDEEFTKRRAASVSITFLLVGGSIGLWVGIGLYTAVEVILDPNLDEEMVELLTEEAVPDLPPPPPPPPAAQAEEQTDETEPTPDELVEDIRELDENVKDEMKSDIKPAGVEGGVEGGVVGGVVGGTLGPKGGSVRVFHHSELEVKKRIYPEYPEAARELNLGDQRCLAVVFMDEEGVPYQVNVDNCPKVFELPTEEAMLKWRWYPPKDGKSKVKAQTTIAVTYKMK
jgi:hypothetical protein